MPWMLPGVKAALVEKSYQEVGAPETEPEAEAVQELETSDPEDEDKEGETVLQAEEPTRWVTSTTRYDRASRLPSRYREELNVAMITGLALQNYYVLLYKEEEDEEVPAELACVGSGLTGGFENTLELHAMNYKAAMKTAG